MRLWNVGDKSEAICPACRRRRATTFEVRDVPVVDRRVTVPDVLVAVCDACGKVAAIPAQSTPLLKQALERAPAKLSARINRRLDDGLRLIAAESGARERDFRALVVRYYLLQLSRNRALAKRVARLAHSELVGGRKTSRLEIRLPEPALAAAWEAAQDAGVRSQTEMIEGVVAAAVEDVLEHRDPRRAARLQEMAALA
jgi:hypothetical protein